MAGARLLADYLEYAGSGGTAAQAPGGAELDPFDADVRDRLAASGRAGHRHNGTRRAGHRPRSRHDLQAYMSQPHWLYLATFTPALSKVGTAAVPRKASRLNEQGPLCATYLAEVPGGRTVRDLEDVLSRELGITQTARRTAKLAALVRTDIDSVQQAHDSIADRAVAALTRWGITPARQQWPPPAESLALRSPHRQGQRAACPHELREGARVLGRVLPWRVGARAAHSRPGAGSLHRRPQRPEGFPCPPRQLFLTPGRDPDLALLNRRPRFPVLHPDQQGPCGPRGPQRQGTGPRPVRRDGHHRGGHPRGHATARARHQRGRLEGDARSRAAKPHRPPDHVGRLQRRSPRRMCGRPSRRGAL